MPSGAPRVVTTAAEHALLPRVRRRLHHAREPPAARTGAGRKRRVPRGRPVRLRALPPPPPPTTLLPLASTTARLLHRMNSPASLSRLVDRNFSDVLITYIPTHASLTPSPRIFYSLHLSTFRTSSFPPVHPSIDIAPRARLRYSPLHCKCFAACPRTYA